MLSVLTFRTPPRRSRRPTTRRTACPPASGPTRARASSGWPTSCAPASCGPTRSTGSTPPSPFGGYKESGYGREGGRHGLEAYLRRAERASTSARPTSSTSAGRSPARSPAAPTWSTTARAVPGQRRAGLPQGRPRRRGGRTQGVRRLGRRARRTTAARSLYRIAEVLEGRRVAVRRRGAAAPRALAAAGRGRRRRRHRPLVWYAGWADKIAQVVGGANPVAGAVLQLLGARADRRRRPSSPRRTPRCWAWSASSRRSIVTGNTVVVLARRAAAARGHAVRGARHLRRARWRRQRAHRRARRHRARRSPRTWTSTPST